MGSQVIDVEVAINDDMESIFDGVAAAGAHLFSLLLSLRRR